MHNLCDDVCIYIWLYSFNFVFFKIISAFFFFFVETEERKGKRGLWGGRETLKISVFKKGENKGEGDDGRLGGGTGE